MNFVFTRKQNPKMQAKSCKAAKKNNESLICPEIVPKVLILTICNLIYFSWQSNHVPIPIIISIVEVIELSLQMKQTTEMEEEIVCKTMFSFLFINYLSWNCAKNLNCSVNSICFNVKAISRLYLVV